MKLTASDLAQVTHSVFRNRAGLEGKPITGVSTDSRKVRPGDLFVAIKGEQFDGGAFLRDAFGRGAVAAIVTEASAAPGTEDWPLLLVGDTLRALGELALLYRRKFTIPVLAIAGSNGKTTTKEMTAKVLGMRYRVLSTEGNLNNHIGVPQTLFRLEKRHEIAVVEAGTNHPGELAYLCSILEPTHGLITGIGREHLEFFRTLRGVAKEEGALFDHLAGRQGSMAVVNADERRLTARARRVRRRFTYGMTARGVDVRGTVLRVDDRGCASLRCLRRNGTRGITVQLGIPGLHHASNALAAAAVGYLFGVSSQKIRQALEDFRPVGKRMEVKDLDGVTVFDDSYNANPDSTIAALRTLAAAHVAGKRVAVLGDMLELGAAAAREHARVGREASRLRIDYLLTFGSASKNTHEAAGKSFAVHYDQKNILAEYLAELVAPGDAILVKGSRGMKMEDIVTFLAERRHATPAIAG